MTFQKLGRNCPICNGISRGRGRGGGDCRQSANQLIHCRTGLELSTIPVGWKFIKLDNAGFGLFAPDDSDWNSSQKQEWQQKVEADRKLRLLRQQQELASALPVAERNHAIKKLHKYLGLSQKHRTHLRARHLTDAQIDAGYFFTIHPDQELPPGIPANLPGIISTRLNDHAWGRLATKTLGFACPAFDVEGNIIGWQLRVDDATDNKYRWAKGWKSSHLPNGELPITVCRPVSPIGHELACTDPTTRLRHECSVERSERSAESVYSELVESVLQKESVGLAEGLLKPYIAAQTFGSIFIGAAGGNFAPKQLKASLDALKPTIVTLYPDAGSVSNPHVMRQYEQTINLVTGWGMPVQVAWWGQIDKTHPDVDELIGSELSDSELIDSELIGSELVDSELIDPASVDSKLITFESTNLDLIGLEVEASESTSDGVQPNVQGDEPEAPLRDFYPLPQAERLELTTPSQQHSGQKITRYTNEITYITPQEFLALGAQYSGYTPSTQKLNDRQNSPIDRDEWELTFGFGKRLRERIKQTLNGFKGFGLRRERSVERKTPSPVPELPEGQPKPKEAPDQLFQDANERLQTWQDAVSSGYKYILDKSAPGLGKSHAAGIALPNALGVEKLWYLANDHRNPTTGVIETNYTDLPVRHNGLKIDDSRHTPNGNPFLIWAKPGEQPDTQGNCYRTELFFKFRAKNLNVEASGSSPICQSCKLAPLCKSGIGAKYSASFRGDRRSALAADRIRAHADSLPSQTEFDYSSSGLLWDEASSQIKPMAEVEVSLKDFDQAWAELEVKAPELHIALKPVRLALRPLLSGDVKQPYHGWDDAAIRALLPVSELPQDVLVAIIAQLETIKPDLSFLDQPSEALTAPERNRLGISKAQQQLVNQHFWREEFQEFADGFDKLTLNWLVPFLKVWNGERGAVRCEWGTLSIFTNRDRSPQIAAKAKFNIFLDATASRESLALKFGIDASEIYVIEQQVPDHGNLKIIQVTGMGKLGKDRSDSLNARVSALKPALSEKYPGIRFGDWKAHAEADDAQWFVNLRGSNKFQDVPTLAVFGVPYQNVGHLQAEYQTLTGEYAALDKEHSHAGLQRFIEDTTQAEIEQAVGRLRSHIRPNEELTFIFVGDYDLSFLGLPIEQIEAFQICPEAGTPAQITRWKILEAMKLLKEQGEKITQGAIAHHAGISQPLIAKIAAQFGGWGCLKKILLSLLDPLYSDSNNFDASSTRLQRDPSTNSGQALDDEEKWLAQTYLPILLEEPPEEAVQNIGQVIQGYGISAFLRILGVSSLQTQARLLALVLQGFPEIFLQDFFHYKI